MKYTLINCYADNNKGDLGIILTTVDMIELIDEAADIEAISTFNRSDPCFESEHALLRKKIKVLPAVFGELNLFSAKDPVSKAIRLVIDAVRLLIYCSIPVGLTALSRLLFSTSERSAIDRITKSDHIVSKGGSFLCNDKDLRSKIGLIRFLFIFFVCFKHKKKVTILCQSLGPVYGAFSRWLLNHVLRSCENVVLREDTCIKSYPYLDLGKDVLKLNDIAFFLDASQAQLPAVQFDEGSIKIGVTIKYVERDKSEEYLTMMSKAIEYCIERYRASVYVFPHVTIENDIGNAYNVLSAVSDIHKDRITVFSGNYTPQQLKKLYSNMDVFVGTRLHSAIFAIGELVPSVCISYHGTKSLGVFSNFHFEDYVVTEYSFESLKEKIDRVLANRMALRDGIRAALLAEKQKFLSLMAKIFLGKPSSKQERDAV